MLYLKMEIGIVKIPYIITMDDPPYIRIFGTVRIFQMCKSYQNAIGKVSDSISNST